MEAMTPLPDGHTRWLDDASDVELCRALMEEETQFRPDALTGLRAEIDRRGLDPERVLRTATARTRPAAERRRYLFGGLVLASLGLVPALLPRVRALEVTLHLDNPGNEGLRINVGTQSTLVPPRRRARLPLVVEVREIPLLSIARTLFGDGETASTRPTDRVRSEVDVEIRTLAGRVVEARVVPVGDGKRLFLSLVPGTAYEVESRHYRLEGRVARLYGAAASRRVVARREPWDLDRVPTAAGPVMVDLFGEPFPAALELPGDVGQGEVVVVRRLRRIP